MKNTSNQNQQNQNQNKNNSNNKNNLTSEKNDKKDEPFITNPDYTTTGGKNKKTGDEWSPGQTVTNDENVSSPNQYNR